jgi:hypothetical protein
MESRLEVVRRAVDCMHDSIGVMRRQSERLRTEGKDEIADEIDEDIRDLEIAVLTVIAREWP